MNQKFLEQLTEFILAYRVYFCRGSAGEGGHHFYSRQRLSPACRGGGRSLPQRICPLYPAFRAVQHSERTFWRGPGKGLDVSRRL